jgi:hypothetical protein
MRFASPSSWPLPSFWQDVQDVHTDAEGRYWHTASGLPIFVERRRDEALIALIPGGSFLMGESEEEGAWVHRHLTEFRLVEGDEEDPQFLRLGAPEGPREGGRDDDARREAARVERPGDDEPHQELEHGGGDDHHRGTSPWMRST